MAESGRGGREECAKSLRRKRKVNGRGCIFCELVLYCKWLKLVILPIYIKELERYEGDY